MMKALESLFRTIFEMSLTGCFVIGVVLLARLCLRRTPRVFSYCLWAVVLFRLCCPVSFESVLSLLPRKAAGSGSSPAAFMPIIPFTPNPLPTDIPAGSPTVPLDAPATSAPSLWAVFSLIWIGGILFLLGYGILSTLRLKAKLQNVSRREGNIFEVPGLPTPFVFGLVHPHIYLPAGLDPKEERYILLHEQTHIRRRDYLVKPLAFLALCVHWFNPLCWLAFHLMTADMEMSCDERVLKELGGGIKREYSASLLSLAAGRKISIGGPLAFGEGSVKTRIKNVLNYRRPAFWLILLALAAVVVLAVGLISNPRSEPKEPSGISSSTGQLTLEKVLSLSQKGEALTWEDLKDYPCEETGSGLYICVYPLAETGWSLAAGSGGPTEPFRYVTLKAPSGNQIDIRTEDAEAFVSTEQLNAYYPDSTTFQADLNHDGVPENVITDFSHLEGGNGQIFIRVEDASGEVLWSADDVSTSHAGWISYSTCTVDEKDYLLRYTPYIYQGYANYGYSVFSINPDGSEQVLTADEIEFAIGAGPAGDAFNPEEIADFTGAVNAYMSTGRMLCSTLNGNLAFTPEGDTWTLLEYMSWLDSEPLSCGKDADLLTKLKTYQKEILKPQIDAYEANKYCDILTATITYEDGMLSFTIPDGDRPEGFSLQVSGRLLAGSMGMSWHAFEEESAHGAWEPGKTYSVEVSPESVDSLAFSMVVLLPDGGDFSRDYIMNRDENGAFSWEGVDSAAPAVRDSAVIGSEQLSVTFTVTSLHLSRFVPEEVDGQYHIPFYQTVVRWNDEAIPRYRDYEDYFAEQGDLYPAAVADGAMLMIDFGSFMPDTVTAQKINGVPVDIRVQEGKSRHSILLRGEEGESEGVYAIRAQWDNGNEILIYTKVKYL